VAGLEVDALDAGDDRVAEDLDEGARVEIDLGVGERAGRAEERAVGLGLGAGVQVEADDRGIQLDRPTGQLGTGADGDRAHRRIGGGADAHAPGAAVVVVGEADHATAEQPGLRDGRRRRGGGDVHAQRPAGRDHAVAADADGHVVVDRGVGFGDVDGDETAADGARR
jgi:hypothetical protein